MAVNGTRVDVGRQGDGPASIVPGAGITEQEVMNGNGGAHGLTGLESNQPAGSQNVARGSIPSVGGNVAN